MAIHKATQKAIDGDAEMIIEFSMNEIAHILPAGICRPRD